MAVQTEASPRSQKRGRGSGETLGGVHYDSDRGLGSTGKSKEETPEGENPKGGGGVPKVEKAVASHSHRNRRKIQCW